MRSANNGIGKPVGISFYIDPRVETAVVVDSLAIKLGNVLDDLPGLLTVVLMVVTTGDNNDVSLASWERLVADTGLKIITGVGDERQWAEAIRYAPLPRPWMVCFDIGGVPERIEKEGTPKDREKYSHVSPKFQITRDGGDAPSREAEVILPVLVIKYTNGNNPDLPGIVGVVDGLKLLSWFRGCTLAPVVENPASLNDVKHGLKRLPPFTKHLLIYWAGHGKARFSDETKLLMSSGEVKDGITLEQLVNAVRDCPELPDLLTLTIVLDVCFAENLTESFNVGSMKVKVIGSTRLNQEAADDGEYLAALSERWIEGGSVEWGKLMKGIAETSRGWRHSFTQLVQQGFSWPLQPRKLDLEELHSHNDLFQDVGEWGFGEGQVLIVKGDPAKGKGSWVATLVSETSASNSDEEKDGFHHKEFSKSLRGKRFLERFGAQLIRLAQGAGFDAGDDYEDSLKARRSTQVCSPLYAASANGQREIVKLLLKDGNCGDVDTPNQDGETALFVASANGNYDTVEVLLLEGNSRAVDRPNNTRFTPLYMASVHGHSLVVRNLLVYGHSQAVDMLSPSGETAMHAACANGHEDVVRALFDYGNSGAGTILNKDGDTPLHVACLKGHVGVVRVLLITGGCAVNNPNKAGATPLFIASANGHADIVRFLLSEGAVQTRNMDGLTPMDAARRNNCLDVVRVLEKFSP